MSVPHTVCRARSAAPDTLCQCTRAGHFGRLGGWPCALRQCRLAVSGTEARDPMLPNSVPQPDSIERKESTLPQTPTRCAAPRLRTLGSRTAPRPSSAPHMVCCAAQGHKHVVAQRARNKRTGGRAGRTRRLERKKSGQDATREGGSEGGREGGRARERGLYGGRRHVGIFELCDEVSGSRGLEVSATRRHVATRARMHTLRNQTQQPTRMSGTDGAGSVVA